MKTTVVYHRADFDGLFCREIARKFLGDEDVEYIGWDFGDPPLDFDTGTLYVMDLPCDSPFGFNLADVGPLRRTIGNENGIRLRDVTSRELVWIDHHRTSIESHPREIPGYRIDGVAACRLAWQWFSRGYAGGKGMENAIVNNLSGHLPSDVQFKNREVEEPIAVRLAGEYDIWDHRGDGDLEFQFGLRSEKELRWDVLLSFTGTVKHSGESFRKGGYVEELIDIGGKIMTYQAQMDARMMGNSFLVEFEGLKFLACNAGGRNSNAFASKDVPETGHDALLAFYHNGKGVLMVSLYHAKHRKDLDLSKIAVKYGKMSGLGGGGHPGACGFQWPVSIPLPFIT